MFGVLQFKYNPTAWGPRSLECWPIPALEERGGSEGERERGEEGEREGEGDGGRERMVRREYRQL